MRLKKDYWIAVLCKIFVILTELLITVLLNRGLGIESKGEYAYIIKVVEVLYVFFSFGIGQVYATFKRKDNEEIRNIFVALGLIHSFLIVLIGSVISLFWRSEYIMPIIMLTAIAVVKFIVSMIAVIDKSIVRNILQVFVNVLYLIVLICVCFFNKANLNTVLWCYGIIDILRIVLLIHIYKLKPKIKGITLETIKSVYRAGFVTMIVMLLINLNYSVDTIMLKLISSDYHVGIYSVSVSLANMFLLIPDAFKEVLFGDSARKNFSKKTALSAIKVSLLISFFIFVGFAVFGKWFIKFLYGIEYSSSYSVTIILFFGCFFLIIFKILQPIYIAYGKQNKAVIYLSISATINILANLLIIPIYNEIGAAYASVLSYTVCGLLFFIGYLRNDLK
ncbi:MAG: polysaccharide biosynthesis C-terminal domain-containing protein [Holdemania massiliensis]